MFNLITRQEPWILFVIGHQSRAYIVWKAKINNFKYSFIYFHIVILFSWQIKHYPHQQPSMFSRYCIAKRAVSVKRERDREPLKMKSENSPDEKFLVLRCNFYFLSLLNESIRNSKSNFNISNYKRPTTSGGEAIELTTLGRVRDG